MNRRTGFSLTELLVALVIAGIIGVALSRLVVNQARFVSAQDNMMRARSGARAAYNLLMDELRATTGGGLLQASPDSVTVRVPFAFGLACGQVSGTTVVSLLPTDSVRYASAVISGYAWMDSTATYQFVEPATVSASGTGTCTGGVPPITTMSTPDWPATAVAVTPNVVATPTGAPIFLYQKVRYAFGESATMAGRRALWREVLGSGQRDEMVAPFDTSARFEFLVGKALVRQTTVPGVLDSIRGLRLRLVSASDQAPQGRTQPMLFNFTTNLLFRNHVR